MYVTSAYPYHGSEIAIIGLAGRFPSAKNIDEFWQNIQERVESISFFTDEELLSSGIEAKVLNDPNFVKARGVLENAELFDASFFGFNPREAEITDPQHRVFLECAWEALENAGYDCETYSGIIGVCAGSRLSDYLLQVYLNQNILKHFDGNQVGIANDKDYLTTKVSYKLNLTGPSYTVQTACSTSLVAVHLACQSLLAGECDMALAGGVSINSARKAGYLYIEGGTASPDGHCRAFDAKAQGTVSGEGVGIVVLKRLEDALQDKDTIHAIIKGSAINNDGANKVSYTAPRIEGQAKVVRTAQIVAEVEPETITYIEAHGTGTSLGDPIEIAALTQAFQAGTQKKGFCAIASLKTNIGHLDAAAGVAGLIKTVLALKHKQIPPSLHFEEPNQQIDFDNSPFYVNTTLTAWEVNGIPRRAGVSSFGIGGTNAHIILEEAPALEVSTSSRSWQLLLLSAKTATALETATANLATHLQQNSNLNLADVAHTLQVGRKAFDYRRLLVCQNVEQAVQSLTSVNYPGVLTHYQKPCNRSVVFMFPGQGAQYVNMAAELYQTEPVFADHVNQCAELLRPHLGLDIRQVIYPANSQTASQLSETALTQPALFVIEYALAQLWMAWGVHPEAMIGHSIGEYVAATLAGVFSLEDALMLVSHRGRLMQQLPKGAMLSVQMAASEMQNLLEAGLSLAASNAPSACVVSGTTAAITELQEKLQLQRINCRQLHTSHAFHSQMMEPIITPFVELLAKVTLNPPQIPFISNVSGTWITTDEATDPHYWAKHLRQTVRFSEGIVELMQQPERIWLEVGPGRTLSSLAQQHQEIVTLTSVRHPQETHSDVAFILTTLGRLWLLGVKMHWSGFYQHEQRCHIPLPTYPFERQRYWIEPQKKADTLSKHLASLEKEPDIGSWFYMPIWKQSIPNQALYKSEMAKQKSCWLVFVDECGIGAQLVKRLEQENQDVISVRVGAQFLKVSDRAYALNPKQRDDYATLLEELTVLGKIPKTIVHLWSVTSDEHTPSDISFWEKTQNVSFYSLLFLAQVFGEQNLTDPLQIGVVSNNLQEVTGFEVLCPEKATMLGACKVIPQEYPHITLKSIDIMIGESKTWHKEKLVEQILSELVAKVPGSVVAYRGNHRWVQGFESVQLDSAIEPTLTLRQQGVYLITGGLGGIGLVLAEYLAQTVQARLILIGRSAFPSREEWQVWQETYGTQDDITCKILKVQALEELGAEVLVSNADVANLEQMQAVISQAYERFGKIHGVIHAAGIAGGGVIQLKTPEVVANVFSPKVMGARVLDTLLKNQKLDFFILCSSLNSLVGGFGQIDYCAANSFLDAFARYKTAKDGTMAVSINWDTWQEVGMAVNTVVPIELQQLRQESLNKGISSQEGKDVFHRILCHTLPQVIVSTQDFLLTLEQSHAFKVSTALEKLKETRLSKSTHPRPNLPNTYVAPINETEQIISQVWQELLGIQQVGIYDNFFELGGHSLLATQIISHLRTNLKVELPLRQFFEAPTIAEQANIIQKNKFLKIQPISNIIYQTERDKKEYLKLKLPKIEKAFRLSDTSLSYAQKRLWYIDQLQPNNTAYNLFNPIRISGYLDILALEKSLNEIIRRHEILRTNFIVDNGQPTQLIAESFNLELPIISLSKLSDTEREQTVKTLVKQEAENPFRLNTDPLLRFTLLRLAETEYVLLFTMHHIISDGWSIGVLIKELVDMYEAFSLGQPSPLPELPIQYADFAVWQHQWLQGEVLEQLLTYWQQQLQNLPNLQLPTDYPRPLTPTYQGSAQPFTLSPTLSQQIKILSNQQGVTLFMTLHTAFTTLMHYYSGQDDIVIGTDVANRNQEETEGLIGFFVNQLVLRTKFDGNPTFSELLDRVREVTLDAYTHQDLPFDKLVEAINPERNLHNTPLFQVKLILQNSPTTALNISGITFQNLETETKTATFDLLFDIRDTEPGLMGSLKYSTDLFAAKTIDRMLKHFEIILSQVVDKPNVKINEIKEILAQADKQYRLAQETNYQNSLQQKLGNIKRRSVK
ncbi:hypothetical protein AMR41_08910 [Hapalosiphon sp. MRB220]|nr:hypothetical protein AMR41_08910 [Hapalosiphon sp. MRB220]